MVVVLPFAVSVLVAAFAAQSPSTEYRVPSTSDLEDALHAISGMRYGEDASDEGPAFKPHELLLRMDVESVPDDLLLAVLLAGASFGDPVDASRRLLSEANHDVTRLREPSLWERTKGLGTVGRARIVAATELARRIDVRSSFSKRAVVTSPMKAVAVLKTMSFGPDEVLSVLFLDRARRLIGGQVLTVGSSAFTVVDPKQVYQRAMEIGASALILAHNHPSGNATPSPQDRDVTERVSRVGRILGIPLVDHIVLGSDGVYTSLAEEGALPPWADSAPVVTAENPYPRG